MEMKVTGLNKSFGANRVLNDVSFSVTGGRALGLLGRNGAGKTTTIRILTDIFRADSGTVELGGSPIDYSKARIGYLPEERGLYPKVKVGAQMMYIGELRGMSSSEAKKRALDLLEELDAGEYWNKKLDTLSKGNQQKVQLAISVLHDPDIVILDEPFSGLDPVNAQMLKDMIVRQVKKGKIVLFSSHQMPYVEEFCEHICILHKGRVAVDGRIRDIKKSYPRNKVEIICGNNIEKLTGKISNEAEWKNIVESFDCGGETVNVSLKRAEDKSCLLRILNESGAGIESFRTVEPTLEEIFVEWTGDAQ